MRYGTRQISIIRLQNIGVNIARAVKTLHSEAPHIVSIRSHKHSLAEFSAVARVKNIIAAVLWVGNSLKNHGVLIIVILCTLVKIAVHNFPCNPRLCESPVVHINFTVGSPCIVQKPYAAVISRIELNRKCDPCLIVSSRAGV